MGICDRCITNRDECVGCRYAPQYRDYPNVSKFKEYEPTCRLGYTDCISDPAYIKFHYPDWYKDLYGDKSPAEAAEECCTEEYCYYDDEDK